MKKNEIFQLVHSLTQSEKRYFKLGIQKENSIYPMVFDLILQNKVFDAEALSGLLENKGIKSSLSRIIHHLEKLILTSLGRYHASNHPRYEVMDAIRNYTILRDRGLHQQGKTLLKKALIIAKQNNYFGLIQEIIDLSEDWVTEEDNLVLADENASYFLSEFAEVNSYAEKILELKRMIYALRLFFLKHKFARDQQQKNFLNAFHEKIEIYKNEDNLLIRRLFLTIKIYIYYGLQDFENMIRTEHLRIDLQFNGQTEAHISPFLVFAYHRNILWVLLNGGRFEAYYKHLEALNHTRVLDTILFSTFYEKKLLLVQDISSIYAFIALRQYHNAYHNIDALWSQYKDQRSYWDMSMLINSLILFMNCCFCLGRYQEALKWLMHLEMEVPKNYLSAYRNMGKIAHMMIHFSLGNHKVVRNMINSTRNKLYADRSFYEVASLFLKFFNKYYHSSQESNQEELLRKYKNIIVEISEKEEQKGFFVLFNFVDWFEASIKHCTIDNLN